MMTKQNSYTHIEKELLPKMRELINNAEDKIDLENHFSRTMANLINQASNNEVKAKIYDIVFTQQTADHFKIDKCLMEDENFIKIWNESDLPNVVKRFAQSVNHRYIHIDNQTERTNKKVRVL